VKLQNYYHGRARSGRGGGEIANKQRSRYLIWLLAVKRKDMLQALKQALGSPASRSVMAIGARMNFSPVVQYIVLLKEKNLIAEVRGQWFVAMRALAYVAAYDELEKMLYGEQSKHLEKDQ
jgi:hypothetical protein